MSGQTQSYNVLTNFMFKIFQRILMAFRILRLRKEARRNAKLDEIFQERDKGGTGLISYEQLEDIYRIYQVRGTVTIPNLKISTFGANMPFLAIYP